MNLLLHGIGSETERDRPIVVTPTRWPPTPASASTWCWPIRPSARRAAPDRQRGRRHSTGSLTYRARRLLGHHQQQAAQLRAAHQDAAQEHGRAAVVVPDNVLFEGGAGETIRRKLLHECDVHTLLRLPTGIFYAQGVKANVLFFDRKPASETPWTKKLWIYDLRTNQHFTLKTNPLKRERPRRVRRAATTRPTARAQGRPGREADAASPRGPLARLRLRRAVARDKASLDIFWLKDDSLADSDNLPPPDVIAQEIVDDLRQMVHGLREGRRRPAAAQDPEQQIGDGVEFCRDAAREVADEVAAHGDGQGQRIARGIDPVQRLRQADVVPEVVLDGGAQVGAQIHRAPAREGGDAAELGGHGL
jgi:type I restriction enzyme M protein